MHSTLKHFATRMFLWMLFVRAALGQTISTVYDIQTTNVSWIAAAPTRDLSFAWRVYFTGNGRYVRAGATSHTFVSSGEPRGVFTTFRKRVRTSAPSNLVERKIRIAYKMRHIDPPGYRLDNVVPLGLAHRLVVGDDTADGDYMSGVSAMYGGGVTPEFNETEGYATPSIQHPQVSFNRMSSKKPCFLNSLYCDVFGVRHVCDAIAPEREQTFQAVYELSYDASSGLLAPLQYTVLNSNGMACSISDASANLTAFAAPAQRVANGNFVIYLALRNIDVEITNFTVQFTDTLQTATPTPPPLDMTSAQTSHAAAQSDTTTDNASEARFRTGLVSDARNGSARSTSGGPSRSGKITVTAALARNEFTADSAQLITWIGIGVVLLCLCSICCVFGCYASRKRIARNRTVARAYKNSGCARAMLFFLRKHIGSGERHSAPTRLQIIFFLHASLFIDCANLRR